MSDTNSSILAAIRDGSTLETPASGFVRFFFNLSGYISTKDSTGAVRSYQFTPPTSRISSAATDTAADGETIICTRAGIQTINLPSAATDNQRIKIKSTTSNEITIDPFGSETIFTYQVETSLIINAAGGSLEITSSGGSWYVTG